MRERPSGTVTFLFTDIEGSTRLWEEQPEAMKRALVAHDRILRDAIEHNDGYVFATGGDSFAAAFARVNDGLLAAVEAQQALASEEWGKTPIRVRMALHSGEAEERDGDYFGPALNRAARLMSVGHGGQVLVSQSVFEISSEALPEELAFDDLGQHRLKDLDRAGRIYQLLHPALPAEFAALSTLDYRPNNLPIQLTSFIGREDDIDALVVALADARLITVTGVGGSGKTRLALQAAAEVLSDYPGGVWLVELADIVDPDLVLAAVAAELRVTERQGWSVMDSLAAVIGDQHLLLLIDNCEHLVGAAAEAAAGLLERSRHLRVLATSRELLGVPGEVPFAVRSLSLPPVEGNGEMIQDSDAVKLFVERAETAKPGFQLTSSNGVDIARICRRLDGIPLALELAAARVRVMSPEQIWARLDDQFSLLTGGARTALPRQRTLQATIEWSYQLLDEDEQAVFQSLSVFVGGFAPDSAEHVASTGQITGFAVTDVVHRLVDKSLVVAVEEPRGSIRYRLLETIRQFAADELLNSGRANDVRHCHAQAFATFAVEQEQPLRTGGHGLDALTVEHDNIRAALRRERSLTRGCRLATRGARSDSRHRHPGAGEPPQVAGPDALLDRGLRPGAGCGGASTQHGSEAR
jgi:predicted ATPase/class 3 adenylate cyclase